MTQNNQCSECGSRLAQSGFCARCALAMNGFLLEETLDPPESALHHAVLMSPTNALALARLGRTLMRQDPGESSRNLCPADFLSARALVLDPSHPEVVAIRQEIQNTLARAR